MDYCYNNAVIHVFLGNLAQFIVPHHNAKYKDSDKVSEEILEFAIIDPPTPVDDQSSETPMTSRYYYNGYIVGEGGEGGRGTGLAWNRRPSSIIVLCIKANRKGRVAMLYYS